MILLHKMGEKRDKFMSSNSDTIMSDSVLSMHG